MEQPTSEVSKVPQKSVERNRNILQRRPYEIEGSKINVSWKEFSPTDKETSQDEAVLFLTGWSAGTAKTLEYLSQRFAEDSGKEALMTTTRPEKVVSDSLYKEAQAVRNLIVEKGLKKIIIAGHSEGGIKAVDLIDILQKENKNIDVQGLILLDPVGLYKQNWAKFASRFTQDTLLNTPVTVLTNLAKDPSLFVKMLQAAGDIGMNIAKDIAATNLKDGTYFRKLYLQVKEMTKKNTHYQDVKCPVVLIQGAQDPVSSPDRIVSKEERIRYANEAKERADKARKYRKSLPKEDKTIPRWPNDPNWADEINQAVQKVFFPNSPYVKALVGTKIPHHGIPHFRSDSISKVALGLLRRYWKAQESLAQPTIPATASQGETLRS